jgi:hypothetical protein
MVFSVCRLLHLRSGLRHRHNALACIGASGTLPCREPHRQQRFPQADRIGGEQAFRLGRCRQND